jgi:hypothetical protein
LEAVLPLDHPVALEAANPVSPEARVKMDPRKVRAREDARVKGLLEGGPVAVIVLGGAHDLSASVRALAPRSESGVPAGHVQAVSAGQWGTLRRGPAVYSV